MSLELTDIVAVHVDRVVRTVHEGIGIDDVLKRLTFDDADEFVANDSYGVLFCLAGASTVVG